MSTSLEDISQNFGEYKLCKNQTFENFDESQMKLVSPELI